MSWLTRTMPRSTKDWLVHLECICADDFGAGYKQEIDLDEDDIAHIKNYEEIRNNHHRLAVLASEIGIDHSIQDTDDRDSRHSDAYLYFWWSQLHEVIDLLRESDVTGDILDVPENFPIELENQANNQGWNVERKL